MEEQSHHGLANKGEDNEKGNKLGINVQHVNLVMGKHDVEEGGERRDQAGPEGVDDELDLGGCSTDRSSG